MNIWSLIARVILRNRILILSIIALFTLTMAYFASGSHIAYQFAKILPDDEPVSMDFAQFEEEFGNANNSLLIAVDVDTQKFFTKDFLNEWKKFISEIKSIDGIVSTISVTEAVKFVINDSTQKFELSPLLAEQDITDEFAREFQMDLNNMPFYKNVFFTDDFSSFLIIAKVDENVLYSKKVTEILGSVDGVVKSFETATKSTAYISGVPYILFANAKKLEAEIQKFIALTVVVTALILFFFLKSFRATVISLMVVFVGVISTFGLFGLLGYEISLVASLIPPLVIVIGIPNCIYLINKYHTEFKLHKNKALSLQRVIRKIGYVTLLTNTTTALGFAAFILTDSKVLVEFGIVTSINILIVFILSLTIIPIIYSYSKPPKERHYKHLDKKWVILMVKTLDHIVTNNRTAVYVVTLLLIAIGIYGSFQLTTTGSMTDDFADDDPILVSLRYFEKEFNGVMPLEVVIDTKKKKGVIKPSTLEKIEEFQRSFDNNPHLSRSLSIVDFIKFAKQGFYNNDPSMYSLPNRQDRSFILSALPKEGNVNSLSMIVDSTQQKARISFQIAQLSTTEMKVFRDELKAEIDRVFDSEKYDVLITGSSIKWLRSTDYLVKNLIVSLSIAIIVISIIMSFLFGSIRMVFISIIPNFIPLLLTGGIMGIVGIPIKPSTILVFSIAFGISVDDTIHFLAKYRQELSQYNWNIAKSVKLAIEETGVSMFYTSIVLFFGFSIFTASEFGGSQALGLLVAITLFFAMFANLIILPSFLMSLDKWVTTRNFSNKILVEEVDKSELIEEKNTNL